MRRYREERKNREGRSDFILLCFPEGWCILLPQNPRYRELVSVSGKAFAGGRSVRLAISRSECQEKRRVDVSGLKHSLPILRTI